MEKVKKIFLEIKGIVAIAGGYIASKLGGWDTTLKVLVYFVCIDYILGILAAGINGELNSKKGFKGTCKKICLFVPVGMAFALDQLLNTDMLRNMAAMFYIANEGLSVAENLAKMGAPLPDFLINMLTQLKEENKEVK